MCGINGIFAYHSASSSPDESELLTTREAMRTRGPDGAGTWWNADRHCGLGHRRLSIIDLSDRAAQPMISEDGRFVVVFNGEIYNYPQLRVDLEHEGTHFRTTCDTEVLLHLYWRYGGDMVHRIRGMYAFAIWDDLERGLFLARDPYGIKPLYVANDGWTFRFASQVKALLAGKKISRDPEPAGIVGFHLFGSVPEPFTLYRDIRTLPAGHTQWVDTSGPRLPKPFVKIGELVANNVGDAVATSEIAEVVRTAVLDSVRAHLLADVEVGIFLSAGIDSGALLGMMRDAGQQEIRSITLAFEEFRGTPDDEAPLAALVCRNYGAAHVVRPLSADEFQQDLPSIFDAMDQPSIDGINSWFVSKAAKEAGLKVAISGLGGDELFGGYPSSLDLPRWRRTFGPFASIPGFGALARRSLQWLAPDISRTRPKALGILEYSDSWAGAYLLRRGLFLPHELPNIMDPVLAREGLRRLNPLSRLSAHLTSDVKTDSARVCVLESSHYMRNQLLRDVDWASMAHGLEVRVPLVDMQLLQALAPVISLVEPGAGKAVLAIAPTRPLPRDILIRAKTGFNVPTAAWMDAVARRVAPDIRRDRDTKGLISRRWSQLVLRGTTSVQPQLEMCA
jgi:asparagine synthase (glutamine-hydrolysing)